MSQDYASQFSVHNIPFGVASSNLHSAPQGVTRIGNSVIFLDDCSKRGFLAQIDGLPTGVFAQNTLNSFAAISKHIQRATREALQNAWTSASATSNFPKGSIEDISDVTMHLPFRVGEFIGMINQSCSRQFQRSKLTSKRTRFLMLS
jgi:fumarylacetoacetase